MPNLLKPNIVHLQRGDSLYPHRLLDLCDPPSSLYIDGNPEILNSPMVAIVGSRCASREGIANAAYFAQALSHAGLLVISGMARGVDGAAHWGALKSPVNPATLAVCGTGLDLTYPAEHEHLAQSIRQHGLLVSELAPGAGPKASHFPRRNRLIAALSLGVLVIEAAERSGSLITARLACELGREVFALPGSIHKPLAAGCNLLIQQGAKLTKSPQDVLDELKIWS